MVKKKAHLLPETGLRHAYFACNPAILWGPVALRLKIALDLPFSNIYLLLLAFDNTGCKADVKVAVNFHRSTERRGHL